MTALKIHAYDVPQPGAPESYQSAVDPNAYVPESNGLLVKMSGSLLSSTISATTANSFRKRHMSQPLLQLNV